MKKTNYTSPMLVAFFSLRSIALVILCATSLFTNAQQIPLLSTYSFNKFLINPAFTGIDNEYRAFGLYRSQWGAMPNRPVTGGATVEASWWKDRIGTGMYVIHDQIGIFHQTQVNLAYAQKIRLAKDHQLSLGLQAGIVNNSINFMDANAKDANDPGLLDQKANRVAFDISAGISYKWKDLLIGVSLPRIAEAKSNFVSDSTSARYKYVRHYTAFAQYRIGLIKGKFGISPTLFMRKSLGSGYQFDATVLLDYKKMLFIGGGYRNSFGMIAMAGVNLFDMVTVAYAYDAATTKVLKGNVGATHEITFGFHIGSNTRRKEKEALEQAARVAPDTTTVKMLAEMKRTNDSLNNDLNTSKEMLGTLSQEKHELEQNNKALSTKVDSLRTVISKLDQTLAMQSITDVRNSKETTFTLDKIYFEYGKSDLLPDSKSQLDSLAGFLKRFPEVEIEIKGYTDNKGSADANLKMSEERAKAVADYLVSQGIDARRLTYKGMGSEKPVADNNSEEGRKQNRRVEFSITKK